MKRVMLVSDYVKAHPDHEGKKWTVPNGATYFEDVCFEDGTPVIYTELVLRVGSRKWLKVKHES